MKASLYCLSIFVISSIVESVVWRPGVTPMGRSVRSEQRGVAGDEGLLVLSFNFCDIVDCGIGCLAAGGYADGAVSGSADRAAGNAEDKNEC